MQTPKKILFVGCGDLAQGCIPAWSDHHVTAIARQPKTLPAGVEFWQGDIASAAMGERLRLEQWDAVVITLTPDSSDYAAYKQTYWVNSQYILHALAATAKPLILFVSSTSIYGQTDGSWVDETSPTQPTDDNAACLLATEQLFQACGRPIRILRCSGIYGPGRDFLWQQVRQGKGGDQAYTNRIHRDDVCGIINFLLARFFEGITDPDVIIGSDDMPARSCEVRAWLAQLLEVSVPLMPSASLRGGDKRLSNALIRQLGYHFIYPDFISGYQAMLKTATKIM